MILAENVATAAAKHLGRLEAHDRVEAASHRALDEGRPLRQELLEDEKIGEALSEEEIDAALDPAGYLGLAGKFVDRVLGLYRKEVPG